MDKPKKRVHFGSLEVREHKITLGDHPDYVDLETKDLETYESSRGPRRSRDTLCMSFYLHVKIYYCMLD